MRNVPGERLARVQPAFETGQAPQEHVRLHHGALVLVGGPVRATEHAGERLRAGVDEDVARIEFQRVPAQRDLDVVAPVVGLDALDRRVGQGHHARLAGHPGELADQRAHAADRNAPFAGAVVGEDAVLQQPRVVRRGGHAGLAVREDDPAQQVVVDQLLQRLSERAVHEALPLLVGQRRPPLLARAQRLEQAGRDRLSVGARERLERLQLPHAVAAGQASQRLARPLRVDIGEDQGAAVVGCAGGDRPPPQVELQAEVGHHLAREQADQVRVARQPGLDAREHLRRAGRAAEPSQPLQHEHGDPARPR